MNAIWRFPPGADFAFMRCSSDRVVFYSYVDTTPLLRVIAAHCSRAERWISVFTCQWWETNIYTYFFYMLSETFGIHNSAHFQGHWVIRSVCEMGWATEEQTELICSCADGEALLPSGVRGRNGQTVTREKLKQPAVACKVGRVVSLNAHAKNTAVKAARKTHNGAFALSVHRSSEPPWPCWCEEEEEPRLAALKITRKQCNVTASFRSNQG